MSIRTPAEVELELDPGQAPEVVRGPVGVGYHVKGMKKYLVFRTVAERGKASRKDLEEGMEAVATKEVWTDSKHMALHLVDAEHNPLPQCRCEGCRGSK